MVYVFWDTEYVVLHFKKFYFLHNAHKRYPLAHLLWHIMEWPLWARSMIFVATLRLLELVIQLLLCKQWNITDKLRVKSTAPDAMVQGMARTHYSDVIMGVMASQITCLMIVYSTVYSGTDQRKHQISTSLAFVRGIHRWPVNSPHKGPVMR